MKKGYPPKNTFVITYDEKEEMFSMFDRDGECIGRDRSGRELGRDAWEIYDADEVEYKYDCKLDDDMLLTPRHEKYKTRS